MVDIEIGTFSEEVESQNVSGTTDVDLDLANTFHYTLTNDITLSFINATGSPPGNSFTLILQQDGTGGRSVTWPSGTIFTDGLAPTLDGTSNSYDVFTFMTPDGGTTWIGMQGVAGGLSI